jgi:hypothetical protein
MAGGADPHDDVLAGAGRERVLGRLSQDGADHAQAEGRRGRGYEDSKVHAGKN